MITENNFPSRIMLYRLVYAIVLIYLYYGDIMKYFLVDLII